MVKAFYLKNAYWEIDFLVQDVFAGLDTSFFNENEPMLLEPSDIGNCVLVINDSYSFERVQKIVKKIRPVAIFHLSDETGSKGEWLVLAEHCKYLFKQHNHRHCRLDKYPNVIQLPCGYAPTMFGGASSFNFIDNLVPVAERTLDWAFIGSMKSDRHEMCTMFDRYFKNGHCTVGNNSWDATNQIIRPCDMAAIYRKTIFVPIGRGFVTLDCFRCYEALLCGAIPIIVGPEDEIKTAYWFNGCGPAVISAATWADAAAKCRQMRDSASGLLELQSMQEKNVAWWKGLILGYRAKIREAIELSS